MWPKVAKILATFLGHLVGCIDRMPVFNLATFVLYVVNSSASKGRIECMTDVSYSDSLNDGNEFHDDHAFS